MNTYLLGSTFVMQQTHGQGKKRPYCLMKIFFLDLSHWQNFVFLLI